MAETRENTVYYSAKVGGIMRSLLSVCLSFCLSYSEQDSSRARLRTSTKHGRHGNEWPSRNG